MSSGVIIEREVVHVSASSNFEALDHQHFFRVVQIRSIGRWNDPDTEGYYKSLSASMFVNRGIDRDSYERRQLEMTCLQI